MEKSNIHAESLGMTFHELSGQYRRLADEIRAARDAGLSAERIAALSTLPCVKASVVAYVEALNVRDAATRALRGAGIGHALDVSVSHPNLTRDPAPIPAAYARLAVDITETGMSYENLAETVDRALTAAGLTILEDDITDTLATCEALTVTDVPFSTAA